MRKQNINTEFYPEDTKLKKQFSYCDKKNIPFMCIIGEEEIEKQVVTLKNMQKSEQHQLTLQDLISFLQNH